MSKSIKVTRCSPTGECSSQVNLTLTFNSQLVALGPVNDSDPALDAIQLLPTVSGRWKWVDPKSVKFHAEKGFQPAVTYVVKLEKWSCGGKAVEDFEASFTTKPWRLDTFVPTSRVVKKPLFVARCDLAVDAAVFLKNFEVVSKGGKRVEMKRVEFEEARMVIATKKFEKRCDNLWYYREYSKEVQEKTGKVVFFTPTVPLPLDSQFQVKFFKQTYQFSTYAPLKFHTLSPSVATVKSKYFNIQFNNKIESFENFTISPKMPKDIETYWEYDEKTKKNIPKNREAEQIRKSGNSIQVRGRPKCGNMVYSFAVKNVIDVFGQKVISFQQNMKVQPLPYSYRSTYQTLNVVDTSDSAVDQLFSISCLNVKKVKIAVYQVSAKDFVKFRSDSNSFEKYGKKVKDELVSTEAMLDKWKVMDYKFDMKDLQNPKARSGNIIVYLSGAEFLAEKGDYYGNKSWIHWFQFTTFSVDAYCFRGRKSFVFVSELATGKPVPVKDIEIFTPETPLKFEIENDFLIKTINIPRNLVVKMGNCEVFISDVYNNTSQFTQMYKFFTCDARKMYQPGDTVPVKGYLRKLSPMNETYEVTFPETDDEVSYTVRDPRRTEITKGKISVGEFGSFNFDIILPKKIANLGNFNIELKFKGYSHRHSFKVEEFKIPPFLVSVRSRPKRGFGMETKFSSKVDAKYMDGTAVKNAKTTWKITKTKSYFSPKAGYVFYDSSSDSSYFEEDDDDDEICCDDIGWGSASINFSQKTNERGNDEVGFSADSISKSRNDQTYDIKISCSVQDSDQTSIAARGSVKVFPCEVFVGIRCKQYSPKLSDVPNVSFIVVDVDGNPVEGVEFSIGLKMVGEKDSQFHEMFKSGLECINLLSLQKEKKEKLKFKKSGRYSLFSMVIDKMGRKHRSALQLWVAESKSTGVARIECQEISISPNKDEYSQGDVAKLLIQAPFEKSSYSSGLAFGVLDSVVFTKFFEVRSTDGNMKVITLPILERYLPEIALEVRMFGVKFHPIFGKKMCSFAKGRVVLPVSLSPRNVDVKVVSMKSCYSPGSVAQLSISFEQKDINQSEITLIVVDKAILSLSGYKLTNPLTLFYPKHHSYFNERNLRSLIQMKVAEIPKDDGKKRKKKAKEKCCDESESCDEDDDEECEEDERCCEEEPEPEAFGITAGGKSGKKKAVSFRKNFNPIAYYNACLMPDEKGRLDVKFKLPDSITTYVCWALVTEGERKFGLGETSFLADRNFTVQPRLPMFLNYGDVIDICVILNNKVKGEGASTRTCRISTNFEDSKLDFVNSKDCVIEMKLPSNERTKLLIPVKTQLFGKAGIQIVAELLSEDGKSVEEVDAVKEVIDIQIPSTKETFCEYGEIGEEKSVVKREVDIPLGEVFTNIGGIQISLSSTVLQHATDAVIYLNNYQYDCTEQTASRILSLIGIYDILESFNSPNLPKKDEIQAVLSRANEKFKASQRSDGGFGFWPSATVDWPYISLYVGFALVQMKLNKKDVEINEEVATKSREYVMDFCSGKSGFYEKWKHYSICNIRNLKAYALYIATLHHRLSPLTESEITRLVLEAEDLFSESEKDGDFTSHLNLEGYAFVLFCLAKLSKKGLENAIVVKILEILNNNVNETAQTANFVTKFDTDSSYRLLCSSRRTDGILLEILCDLGPKSFLPLIPKIVKGLLNAKIKGRNWRNTQENLYVLFGLKKYFEVFEKEIPNFKVEVAFGENQGQIVGDTKFKGRESDTRMFDISMQTIADSKGKGSVFLVKDGPGRMYWRCGVDYSPLDLHLKEKDRGFKVSMEYASIEDSKDVVKSEEKWILKLGKLVRVKVLIKTETRRYHFAASINIPSGCEILNPNLKTTGDIPKDEKSAGYWIEHTNYRKDRVEIFNSSLREGEYYYSFVVRCVNSGEFLVPPAKAEEMYSPEVFGRFKTETVVIQKD